MCGLLPGPVVCRPLCTEPTAGCLVAEPKSSLLSIGGVWSSDIHLAQTLEIIGR